MNNLSPFLSSCISFVGMYPFAVPHLPDNQLEPADQAFTHTAHISKDFFFSHFCHSFREKKDSEASYSYHHSLLLSGFLFYFSLSVML